MCRSYNERSRVVGGRGEKTIHAQPAGDAGLHLGGHRSRGYRPRPTGSGQTRQSAVHVEGPGGNRRLVVEVGKTRRLHAIGYNAIFRRELGCKIIAVRLPPPYPCSNSAPLPGLQSPPFRPATVYRPKCPTRCTRRSLCHPLRLCT